MKSQTTPTVLSAPTGQTATAATTSRTGTRSTADRLLQQFPARSAPPASAGDSSTIEEITARIRLAQYRSPNKNTNTIRRRGARLVLEWLQSFPGDTWQQRWEARTASHHQSEWAAALNWLNAQGVKTDKYVLQAGLLILAIAEVIHLDLQFILGLSRIHHWGSAVAAHRDPAGFERLRAAVDGVTGPPHEYHLAQWQIAMLVLAKGGRISDITVGDCIELRWLEVALKLKGARRYLFYIALRDMGGLPPDAPTTLRAITIYSGQHSVEELIDRYHLAHREIRNLLVDYLAERQPALDYISLESLSRTLGLYFWKNLETHNPGIDSLHLAPEVAAAWKDRIRFKTTRKRLPDGSFAEITSARVYYGEIVSSVRAFYMDIAQWASEDPGRWAQWVVPCPIRDSEISFKKANSRRKARMDQRTRVRLPVLPRLVRAAEQHAREARIRLEAVLAASPGESFTVLGETFIKAIPEPKQGSQAQTAIVTDSTGRKRRLREAENRAFWGWAAVEFLRHTGVRIEEMLETSHHNITQYRLPTTGEVIPLLHIAPSKTDQERLLVVSPELANVLSVIVARVRTSDGTVPAVPFYDVCERVWAAPTSVLFQWTFAGHRQAVSAKTIRTAINEVVDAANLTDIDGQPLYFLPHDLRRIFATEAILNGMPPHIAQLLLGHKHITTTMGYKAIYPQEAINGHRAFIARRRALRPSEEYRTPTEAEWEEFLSHFERRKVALGECGRAYGSSCQHEHSCIRCPVLRVDPAQRARLEEIRDNLTLRVVEAEREGWLGEAEGLRVSLAATSDKLAQLDDRARRATTTFLSIPTFPEIASSTITATELETTAS